MVDFTELLKNGFSALFSKCILFNFDCSWMLFGLQLLRLQKRSLEYEQSQDGSTTPLV